MHSTPTARPSRYGLTASRNVSDRAGRLASKHDLPSASRMCTYSVLACKSPPVAGARTPTERSTLRQGSPLDLVKRLRQAPARHLAAMKSIQKLHLTAAASREIKFQSLTGRR